MDLTFQVPMQACSLQHRTLLPSPVTPPAGCCFLFGSVSSSFLELFLHSSPVAYWAPTHHLSTQEFHFSSSVLRNVCIGIKRDTWGCHRGRGCREPRVGPQGAVRPSQRAPHRAHGDWRGKWPLSCGGCTRYLAVGKRRQAGGPPWVLLGRLGSLRREPGRPQVLPRRRLTSQHTGLASRICPAVLLSRPLELCPSTLPASVSGQRAEHH